MKKKLGKYGLPLKVIFCSRCTRSNQRPHNVGEFKQTDRDTKKFVSLDNNNHICDADVNFMNINKVLIGN